MRLKLPDWLVYVLVIAVLWAAFTRDEPGLRPDADWPERQSPQADPDTGPMEPDQEPEAEDGGDPLPAPSSLDDEAIVKAEAARPWSTGTAFAIAPEGVWLTARHVVRGCPRVGVTNADMSLAVEAEATFISNQSDVAILRTKGGPGALALDLEEGDLARGASGFHVGYPQGEPGDVVSRLIGRERLYTEGHWRGVENTLAWAEVDRSDGLKGTLGGLSGGPVFDARGRVLGITIAESPRRGRVITTAADSVEEAIGQARLTPQGSPAPAFSAAGFDQQGERLRARSQVVRVVCLPEA